MIIKKPSLDDFFELYKIGKETKELRVSAVEEFMDPDEFRFCITNQKGVFLIAEEENKIAGFVYADARDANESFERRYACLVYIAVIPEFRGKGIGRELYSECEDRLKKLGITNLYCWANAEDNDRTLNFMKANNFSEGHKYIWMDKKIS